MKKFYESPQFMELGHLRSLVQTGATKTSTMNESMSLEPMVPMAMMTFDTFDFEDSSSDGRGGRED